MYRNFKLFSVFALVALLLSVGSAVAQELPRDSFLMESGSPTAEQIDTDYPVGHAARDIGVRAYDVTQSQNGLSVFFLHKDNSRQGTLIIKGFGEGDGIFMELRRSNEVLAVTWNRNIGDFTLDAEEQSAHFWIKERKWVSLPDTKGEATRGQKRFNLNLKRPQDKKHPVVSVI